MATTTTIGRLLVDRALPPPLRGTYGDLDKKGIARLFEQIAAEHPADYPAIAQRLSDVARDVAQGTGGLSFGLEHLRPAPAAEAIKADVRRQVEAIRDRTDLDGPARDRAVTDLLEHAGGAIERAVLADSVAGQNPLADQVRHVGRGNATSLRSIRAGDVMYADHHGDPIPLPVLSSYAAGLKPAEYFAAAFGARKGVVDTKFATAQSGFLGKQFGQLAHRLVVTGVDADDDPADDRPRRDPEHPYVGREDRGLPVDVADPDNEGALLARATGRFPRDTVLTPRVLKEIAAGGAARILVRSPIVGGPPQGGVYAKDVGVRDRGGLAPLGDYVGLSASQALAEKMTQGMLSSKHAGGVAGAAGAPSGFKLVDALMQAPKAFPGGAPHAVRSGTVGAIVEAPQGGTYIHVDGEPHYAPPGQTVTVAQGDKVEAGDTLTNGLPNPAEVTRHKGIGAARLHLTHAVRAAFAGSGLPAHRRNVELLARGAVDHVELDAEIGDGVPGDIVPYQTLEAGYTPRAGATTTAPKAALGRYLEVPVLHHTIGTEVRPSVVRDLEEFGIDAVTTHHDPAPFRPVMVRGMAATGLDPDWMTRHLGSDLKRTTLEAVHRGRSSDTMGTSYVPAVAARVDFGTAGPTRGRAT